MKFCNVCRSSALIDIPVPKFNCVSSDIRETHARLILNLCDNCGTLQKVADEVWRAQAKQLYEDYSINHHAGGSDPVIFDGMFGRETRSGTLVKYIENSVGVDTRGRLLDVGCGNGSLLKIFSKAHPAWGLDAIERDNRHEQEILAIPGVKNFCADGISLTGEPYDLIILSGVLEHLVNPVSTLAAMKKLLKSDGAIIISVPNIHANPFDVLVLDHCQHYDDISLRETVRLAGMHAHTMRTDVIGKEIVAIVRPNVSALLPYVCRDSLKRCGEALQKANKLNEDAEAFGIMGASIAAIWIASSLDFPPDFFVDEDLARVGNTLMGLPIHGLNEVPWGSTVFMPMSEQVARKIISRAPVVSGDGDKIKWEFM